MILADTSVWVDQLRRPGSPLSPALEAGLVIIHPFVIGELACGNLRNRTALLEMWSDLPCAPTTTDAEALNFIERHQLMGVGLGYIDIHLLASTVLVGDMKLWTRDKRLAAAASRFGLAYGDAR